MRQGLPESSTRHHKEDLLRSCVNKRADLVTKIVPFFQENQLRTTKRENFSKFSRIIRMMEE